MKLCCQCGKPGKFYRDKRKPDGLYSACADCCNAYKRAKRPVYAAREARTAKRYYEAHREEILAKHRAEYQLNPLKKRDEKLRREYKLSLKEWEALFEAQGRRCYICRTDQTERNGRWHTDHSRRTGRVRRILCYRCNTSLGLIRENFDILAAMARYLEEYGDGTRGLCESASLPSQLEGRESEQTERHDGRAVSVAEPG